jgi:hypothetical protein
MAYRGCSQCGKKYDSLYPCSHERTKAICSEGKVDVENILHNGYINKGTNKRLICSSIRRIFGLKNR